MVKKIIVCSRSQEKTAEAEEVLKKFGIEVVSVENAEIGNLNKIREAAENIGALVALEVANLTGECCICDDCMLSVNALGGRPGFAANISDEAMDDILLALKQTAEGERNALMTCVLVFARPSGGDKKQEAEMFLGEVRGSIASDKCSEAGCDFERIFMPEGYGLTLAQFPIEEKNNISHVGKALYKLAAYLVHE